MVVIDGFPACRRAFSIGRIPHWSPLARHSQSDVRGAHSAVMSMSARRCWRIRPCKDPNCSSALQERASSTIPWTRPSERPPPRSEGDTGQRERADGGSGLLTNMPTDRSSPTDEGADIRLRPRAAGKASGGGLGQQATSAGEPRITSPGRFTDPRTESFPRSSNNGRRSGNGPQIKHIPGGNSLSASEDVKSRS